MKILALILLVPVAVAFVLVFTGWLAALCWNGVPFLEGFHHLTTLQGTCLFVLSNILLKATPTSK